ncbi:MAG: single-stranded DNA-binding protein [Hyphomonadaceae bacterium]
MTNRVTLLGKILDAPKSRSFKFKNGTIEIVSLWIEVKGEHRADRFSVDIFCPKQQAAAKAMRAGVLVEVEGKLRHDRWQNKATKAWTGKVFVAIDPGEGTVRSKGMAPDAETAEAA